MKDLCVVGLGYIGLPTAALFAAHDLKVVGVDIKREVVDAVNSGCVDTIEPNLSLLINVLVEDGRLTASTEIQQANAYIIAVPTPLTNLKEPELSYVKSAGRAICTVLKRGDLVILESTVPPRCTLDVLKPILEESGLVAGKDFSLAYCPERVMPGDILNELKNNHRVIGGINKESAMKARDLYKKFLKWEPTLTDTVTAEMSKLAENTYRDVNIALANNLALICEEVGCSVWDVIKFANNHPRVNLHKPGPGVGGHCIAVDPWFLDVVAQEYLSGNIEACVICEARNVNDYMPKHVALKIEGTHKRITILGCTYKKDVDDTRESPILKLVECLRHSGDIVRIVDPHVKEYNVDVYEACTGAEIVILAVDHSCFRNIDLKKLSNVVKDKYIMDTRNFFDTGKLKELGFDVYTLGVGESEC